MKLTNQLFFPSFADYKNGWLVGTAIIIPVVYTGQHNVSIFLTNKWAYNNLINNVLSAQTCKFLFIHVICFQFYLVLLQIGIDFEFNTDSRRRHVSIDIIRSACCYASISTSSFESCTSVLTVFTFTISYW